MGAGGQEPSPGPERSGGDRWLWAEEQLEQRPRGPMWELGVGLRSLEGAAESWGGTWPDPWDRDRDGVGVGWQPVREKGRPSRTCPSQAWPQDRHPIREGSLRGLQGRSVHRHRIPAVESLPQPPPLDLCKPQRRGALVPQPGMTRGRASVPPRPP